jgi:CBS domain-containing protein
MQEQDSVKASDIMTQPVITVRETCSLEDCARLMINHKIGCLPVTNAEGKLVGILTESDFAAKNKGIPFSLYRFPQVLGEWMPKTGVEKLYAAARSRYAADFMSRPVATVKAADSLETVLATMQRTGFHRVPVVDGEAPVGIIARHDLLRLMLREWTKSCGEASSS